MKKMMRSKKIAAFLAVFFFSFNCIGSYQVSASVVDLIIGGLGYGTAGASGSGLATSLLLPFSVILGYGLKANGIDVNLSAESQQAGLTRTEYIIQQFQNWSELTGKDQAETMQKFLEYCTFDAGTGAIYFGQSALDTISQIGNWIVSDMSDNFYDGNPADVPVDDTAYTTINGVNIPYTDTLISYNISNNQIFYIFSATDKFFVVRNQLSNGNQAVFVSNVPNLIVQRSVNYPTSYSIYRGISGSDMYSSDWVVVKETSGGNPINYLSIGDLPAATVSIFANVNFNDLDITTPSADLPDTFWGDAKGWIDNLPALDLPEGYYGSIDPGVLQGIKDELSDQTGYILNIKDYIKALEDAFNGEAAADVPVEDTETGIPVVVPVPDITVPVYEQVPDDAIPDPEDVIEVVDPEITADPEDLVNSGKFDLTTLFPFCIPFDLYHLFQKFNAPAEAPHFRIQFTIPIVNEQVDYTIDFSPFNNVAVVLRTMELIAMIVLLAIATRRIFLRG